MTDLLVLNPADLAVQSTIRLPLPIVKGNRDYAERESLLLRMDEILILSGAEDAFVEAWVRQGVTEATHANGGKVPEPMSDRRKATVHQQAVESLRCTLARLLSNESHRSFSTHLAESSLLQWFCRVQSTDGVVRVPSKSSLQRMEASVPTAVIQDLHRELVRQATGTDAEGNSTLGLAEAVELSAAWMDSTCAKLDIHYPTDWVLLRDATRSVMASIEVIRRHGLLHRMPEPATFTKEMNKHCMAMSAASRKGRGGDKAKARKKTLRAMKAIVTKVRKHGQRYRDLLEKSWRETDLSEAAAKVILKRLDAVLAAIPQAVKQAHERIIGERVVPNQDKILSLYEQHAEVYVRGKAGADAEFGLQMLLTESAEGLIIDCELTQDGIANDTTLLMPAVKRMREHFGTKACTTVITDRGFTSKANSAALDQAGITDGTLPRSSEALAERLADPTLRALHVRRAQTEARIGIFKANFLGDHLPTKGRIAQERYVAWATLAHNLWVLARLERRPAVAKVS